MNDDFETHPIGTGKRLAELEGLAFARRGAEYTRPVTDEDADAARRAFHADGCSPWGDATPSIRARWRRAAEAVRDRLSGREMVASPTYEEGYETGRRDEAQARAAVRDEQPIVPRDVRVGDLLAITYLTVVTGQDDEYNISTDDYQRHNLHAYNASARLVCRPDPDVELVESLARAAKKFDALDATDDWNYYLKSARATLAALRKTHTIEPRPTTGDLHA